MSDILEPILSLGMPQEPWIVAYVLPILGVGYYSKQYWNSSLDWSLLV